MNAACRFASDAYLATQKRAVRLCIENILRVWELTFDQIQHPHRLKEYAARDATICALDNIGIKIREISEITGVGHREVIVVLESRRHYGQPVRTMNWEAFA